MCTVLHDYLISIMLQVRFVHQLQNVRGRSGVPLHIFVRMFFVVCVLLHFLLEAIWVFPWRGFRGVQSIRRFQLSFFMHKSPAERHQLYTFIYVHLYVSLCVVHIEYVAHTI